MIIKRVMAAICTLLFCFIPLTCPAENEDLFQLSCGQSERLEYRCTLPDGGLILTGADDPFEPGKDACAKVMCLNADRTIRWEYTDFNRNGYTAAELATVLPDGTIAVVFEDYPEKIFVKFFTPEGKLARKKMNLKPKRGETGQVYALAPSFFMVFDSVDRGPDGYFGYDYETVLYNWSGRETARYNGLIVRDGYGFLVSESDALVTYGKEELFGGHAKIMRLDETNGSILWETEPDYQLPGADQAELIHIVQAEDGGYIGWLREGRPSVDGLSSEYSYFLVRFDADGRLLWAKNSESLNCNGSVMNLCTYNGKIVMECGEADDESWSKGSPLRFLWMDLDGNETGTVELSLKPEDFWMMQDSLPENDGIYRFPWIGINQLIPMADGVWAFATFYIAEKEEAGQGIGLPLEKSEIVMIRIPEI